MEKKILIVEDDPFIAAHLTMLVEDELGYVPLSTPTVEQAWELIAAGIDGALLDVEVGDGNTYPLAQFMLRNDIPVIFVSASDPDKVPRDIRDTPFLPKPVHEGRILGAARKYF